MPCRPIHRAATKIALMLAAMAAGTGTAESQAGNPGSYSSRAELTIRIRLANEQPISYPVEVQLLTLTGISITQTFTHGDGQAVFRDTPEGGYRVKVNGSGYESFTSDPFTILHNEGAHSETFRINVTPAAGKKANKVISSGELQVPERARNELEKAEKQFDSGAPDDAVASLRRAIEIYPGYARAYNNLGIVLISKGDLNGAGNAFGDSLKADSTFVPAMINVARLAFRRQDLPKVQDYAERALALEPLNPEALTLLATTQFYQGKFENAVATVNRIHAAPHEGFADAHLIAAEAYQKTGNNPQAIEQCKLFLKENPNSPRAEQVRTGLKILEARK